MAEVNLTDSRFFGCSICFLGVEETFAGLTLRVLDIFEVLEGTGLQITVPWVLPMEMSDSLRFTE